MISKELMKLKATGSMGLPEEAVRKVRRRLEDHLRKADPLLVLGLARAFGVKIPKKEKSRQD